MSLKNAAAEIRNEGSGLKDLLRRRAKIVCTLGPSTSTEPVLRELLRAGMDVARLNFSHGTHEDHARRIELVREVAAAEKTTICIMQDLQGPKMRTGALKDHQSVTLKQGALLTFTPRDIQGTESTVSVGFPLARDVRLGSRILLSDGLIELKVVKIVDGEVECEVVNGGVLGEHKGINLPGAIVSLPSITEKDRADLEFGLEQGVDVVALSFVRRAEDVLVAKRIIHEHGSNVLVIAKLEKPQAIENLEEIFEVADGVMVARGDLGVELAPEKVPVIQKHVIQRAAEWKKPVITATQMLESMIENPRPTRAEASDVANAVFDGSDALMLSAETASGRYPCEAANMMARIILEAEANVEDDWRTRRRKVDRPLSISEAICESVAHAAHELDMKAIALFTQTGTTARLVSKYRPPCSVFAFADTALVANQMNLLWGVHPVEWRLASSAEEMARAGESELLRRSVVAPDDVIGIISGKKGSSGSTNLMRLQRVGTDDPSAHKESENMPSFDPVPSGN